MIVRSGRSHLKELFSKIMAVDLRQYQPVFWNSIEKYV
jgi:hypothetical protein